MGGKDVIHVKQLQKSSLQAVEVQNLLKQSADEKFSADGRGSFKLKPDELLKKLKKVHIFANYHYLQRAYIS